MNRIYKSIWNVVTQSWTAVSEIKHTGKRSSVKMAGVFISTLLLLGVTGTVRAETWDFGYDVNLDIKKDSGNLNNNFAFGSGRGAKIYDDDLTILSGSYTLFFNSDTQRNSVLDVDNAAIRLIDQSRGYDQVLVEASEITVDEVLGIDVTLSVNNQDTVAVPGSKPHSNRYVQKFSKNGKEVAAGVYIMGQKAYEANTDYWNGYGTYGTGIKIAVNDYLEGIFTAAVLTGVHLGSNYGQGTEILELPTLGPGSAGQNQWSATLSGNGGIAYRGTNWYDTYLTISQSNFTSTDPDDELSSVNSYTGQTNVTNLSLWLKRQDSFGQTSKLTATNSHIDVLNDNAWTSVKTLSYDGVETTFRENQTSFTITNGSSDAATFVGGNTIVTESAPFTYTVQGSMEIGSADRNGSLNFKQDSNGTLDLNVNTNLTIFQNSSLSDATNVTVGETLNLYNASAISESSTVRVGTTLNFLDIQEGTYSNNTHQTTQDGKFEVTVQNSTLEYKDGITMSVSDTTIKGQSNLTVHDTALLGSSVTFDEVEENETGVLSVVTIDKTDTDESWNLSNLSLTNNKTDDLAIVFVKGDSFELNESLGNFNGWLRLGNMDFTLTDDVTGYLNSDEDLHKPSTGLSITEGAILTVDDHTSLDKFGWYGNGGVLDLTNHSHTAGDNSPILQVGTLHLDGTGTIKLNPTDYLQAQGPQTGGSVLDYDNGGDKDNRYFIVTADNIQGESAIALEIVGDSDTSAVTELKHGGEAGSKVAAKAYWDYIAAPTSGEAVDGERGVYISYGLKQLELVGGQDDADSSLVIALDSSTDKTLQAQITGNGIIDIVSDDNNSKSVLFSNTTNTFKGTVNVQDGVTLSALAGSLSGSANNNKGTVNVNLIEGSNLHIVAQGGSQQYLNSISAGTDSTVNIGNSTGLVLTGNSFHSVINGTLSGEGTLSMQGGYLLSNSETLNGFDGAVNVNDAGRLAINVKAEGNQTLTKSVSTDSDSWLVKLGKGTLGFDFNDTTRNGTALNVWVYRGTVILDENTSFGNIRVDETAEGITVNGLTKLETLTGSGQIFMDFDFGSDHNNGSLGDAGDGLKVSGSASGDYVLVASSNDLNKGAVETLRVMEVDGDATDFELALQNGYIVSGAFDYRLVRTDEGDGAVFDLTSVDGIYDRRNTTVTAGSYIGIAYAGQMFDLSLHDRVGNRDWINPATGEKQTTSLWMHHTMSHERFRDSTEQLRMRTTSNTTMLGGDLIQWTPSGSGLAYVGVMGGYGTMDTKTHSKQTDRNSSAETDAWGVGVYGGWKADANGQFGPYVDGWIMFTHASSDVTGSYEDTENVNGQGLSAQLEAGWGFKLGSVTTNNGKVANFTIEPHASVTWFGMQYDEIHNDAQDVEFEGSNNIRTRLGARAILTEEGNKDFNAFVETNWVHNSKEYGATISGLTVNQTGSKNQAEARIGMDWHLTQDISVWGRLGASFGSDGYSEREGSIGVRYQF